MLDDDNICIWLFNNNITFVRGVHSTPGVASYTARWRHLNGVICSVRYHTRSLITDETEYIFVFSSVPSGIQHFSYWCSTTGRCTYIKRAFKGLLDTRHLQRIFIMNKIYDGIMSYHFMNTCTIGAVIFSRITVNEWLISRKVWDISRGKYICIDVPNNLVDITTTNPVRSLRSSFIL